jgi:hypothetical protein
MSVSVAASGVVWTWLMPPYGALCARWVVCRGMRLYVAALVSCKVRHREAFHYPVSTASHPYARLIQAYLARSLLS